MAGKEKRRYINYRVDAYLRDRFLQSGRKHKPREICGGGETFMRCFNHVKFCVVCCASLSQAVAPWMLSAMEVLAVLLIYFLATSRSLVIHHHRFSFTRSLEDVVGITCTRAAILSLAYAIGQRSVHRPYLYAAYLLAAACLPYIVVKTILFRYGPDGVAAAAILGLAGVCSVGHVLAARRTVEWARRRYQMGLGGFGMPWEEGEDAWHVLRRPDLEDLTKTSDGGGPDPGEDVPAEMLADDDSKFVELAPGLKIHYKEVAPPATSSSAGSTALGGPDSASTGIVLVHGFGGGVFAWRHVMETLAMQCHCRVVAFDRPGFGLTSRPKANELSNPYTVASQSQLLLQLCGALGLRQVVLVAHADGCLVTLRAAATSASCHQRRSRYLHPQPISSALQPQLQLQPYSSRAPEHARSAPVSADASPKFTSGSPSSPALEQYLPQTAQQQHQQQQAPVQQGLVRQGSASCGGALSAAAFAAAAGEPGASSQGLSHQLCPATGGAALPPDWESGRGVVLADEVARLGTSSYHGSTSGCAVMGSSGDVEVGSLRGEALEVDRASSTSTSVTVALSSQAHHRRAQSVPGPVGAGHCCSAHFSDGWETGSCGSGHIHSQAVPCVLGLVLLHPNLSGNICSAFSRILARSNFGRAILRPLLRTEVGEIANRRAWHNADKLTSEVLEMYKTPLRVEGWDTALVETMKQRKEACQGDLHGYCDSVQPIPTLLATGEHDRIVPPCKSETLGADLPHARLALLKDCGHLSHEEAPSALLEQLVPFCGEVLSRAALR
ncbi:hypothetical protein Agub_g115 [Astrephomene gubernaculifera]|uniref:AB hydrolase-1 domain-containing protein n=1 Tax=Astrephomene gubernaculifera TaxID=47775 RepID=A0AAD3HFS4_9CHLO|nr:hypothetical protein Agub_g115 [Astrephomene gubernaculifera]